MTPVVHSACGTQVGWYLFDAPQPGNIFRSKSFTDMEGNHPDYGSIVKIRCPLCRVYLGPKDMRREFKP